MSEEEDKPKLSATHSFIHHKPKRYGKKSCDESLKLGKWWNVLQNYHTILDKKYKAIRDRVFEKLCANLSRYIKDEAVSFENGSTNSPFHCIPCALVTVPNVCDIPSFVDNLFDNVKSMTSERLLVRASDIRSVPDFVNAMKTQLSDYLGDPSEHSFYSLVAKKFSGE